MNGPINDTLHKTSQVTECVLPIEFEALGPAPQLLPGKSLARYHALRAAIFRDIAPQSAIDWLLAIDVAELSWEIQRYRQLRHSLLGSYRHKGVEAILDRIDTSGVPPERRDAATLHTARNALDWQFDAAANQEIESRLADYGFDQTVISVEVYLHTRELFGFFEDLINGTQLRRFYLLKEIHRHRCALDQPLPSSRRRPSRQQPTRLPLARSSRKEAAQP